MYEHYWKLAKAPFATNSQPAAFFPARSHQAAWLKLQYLVDQRQGTAWVAGPAGVGKSILLNLVEQHICEQKGAAAKILYPQLSAEELLRTCLQAWHPEEAVRRNNELGLDQLWSFTQESLRLRAEAGVPVVLLLDDVEVADPLVLYPWLQQLLNLAGDDDASFSVILCGALEAITEFRRWERLANRVAFQCLIKPFTQTETMAYVHHRLAEAGATASPFTTEACQTIHGLSGGVARRINRLCDFALLVGYADNATEITPDLLEGVAIEIDPLSAAA